MSYVDLAEWGLAKCLDFLPFNLVVDLRMSISILIRVGMFMLWYHVISPNAFQAFEFLFALILWLIFDWQIFLELSYIKGEGNQSIAVREATYKLVEWIQEIATIIYLGVSTTDESNDQRWVIAMLILTIIDFIINVGEYCFFHSGNPHEDIAYGGDVRLAFTLGLIIGVIYAFTILDAGRSADEADRSWVFDPAIVFFAMLGEGFFVFYVITNWFERKAGIPSNSIIKYFLGLVYGFVFAAFSLYYAIFLGIIVFIYILGWLYTKYDEYCGNNNRRVYPN